MDTLDSRSLRPGDCIAIKFEGQGKLRYLLSAGSHVKPKVEANEGVSIEVKPPTGARLAAKQHTVHVKRQGNEYVPDVKDMSIEAGDTVLWHTTDPTIHGFAVGGSGEKHQFNSHLLANEAIYTHAFGTPGTYVWVDAVGKTLSGTVVVKPVNPKDQKELQAWLDSLSKGAAFEIKGGKVTPEKIEIVVGQTVFWKVWDSTGAAIVDKRLLPK